MKKYFIDGIEVTKEDAEKVNNDNEIYSNSEDIADWEKIKFITTIDTDIQRRRGHTRK